MKFFDKSFFRFLVSGGCNTLLSYLIYLGLLQIAPYPVAYTVAFIAAIFSAYALHSFFAFKVSLSWQKVCQYPFIYAVQYGITLVLLFVQIHLLGVDARLAPIFNIIVLIPLTYALNKWVLTRNHAHVQKLDS